jgi:AcrR family transcriptional regulator
MGKLVKRKSAEERKKIARERRASILAAAREVFLHFPYAEVSLETVGRKAGLSKGITEMYHPTRQDLYLQVLRRALDPWFEEIGAELEGSEKRLDPGELATLVSASLTADEVRARLLVVLPTALEYEVEVMPAMMAAQWLRERAEELGARMERRCPALGKGGGVLLLLRLQLLLGGYPSMERVSGMFASALRDAAPELVDADWKREIGSLASQLAVSLAEDR